MQVRAVAVCRPVVQHDSRRLSAAGAPASALQELDILQPDEAPPASAADADLYRDISVEREGKGSVLRLPLYGYRGGAGAGTLCEREVAPLLQRLLAGESCAVIAYGQTGALLAGCASAFVLSSGCYMRTACRGLLPSAAANQFVDVRCPQLCAGSGKSYTMGTEKYGDGQAPPPHSGEAEGQLTFRSRLLFCLSQSLTSRPARLP